MTQHTGTMRVAQDGSFQFTFDNPATICPGQTFKFCLTMMPDLAAVRQVRLYHWRKVCRLADSLCSTRGTPTSRAEWQRQHAEHMKAVQALNDLFPVGDTAERDDERFGKL